MKILYFVSAVKGTASGGHYNSLNQVSMEMAKTCEVRIIMLGKVLSPIIKDNPYFAEHIELNHGLKDLVKLNRRIKQLFNSFQPSIIHCFDTRSLCLIQLSYVAKNIPIVLNKCGGPNPNRKNYYHADATVVFSIENRDWYFNSNYYKNKSIFLIPNRVRSLNLLNVGDRIEKSDPNKVTFVRISRLGGAYDATFKQCMALLEKLNKIKPVEFFLIGRIQNQERFQEIYLECKNKDFTTIFINDERASKGSNFLYLADFVVGTGRSFMEATSLGIPCLTPALNTSIPVLVDSKNVDNFLRTNFSERNVAGNNSEKETIDKILLLISDQSEYFNFQLETKAFFKERFGTDRIIEKYTRVYHFVLNKKLSWLNLMRKNLLYLLRFLISGK